MSESEKLKAEFWKAMAEADRRGREEDERLKLRMAETDKELKAHKEHMAKMDEDIRQQKEQFKLFREEMATSNKLFRAELASFKDELASFKEELSNNTRILGKLTNKLGGIVESVVMPGLVDKFNEKGFSFDSVCTKVEFLNEEKDGNLAEVDALLENGKFVIAVESKTEMKVSDVNAHVKRMKLLRGMPRFKGKKIYGALATAVARKKPMDYAMEQGFFVLRQPDVMRVEIMDFPKGCSAKAY